MQGKSAGMTRLNHSSNPSLAPCKAVSGNKRIMKSCSSDSTPISIFFIAATFCFICMFLSCHIVPLFAENKVSVQFLHRNDQQITSFTATQNKSSNLLWQSIWFILGAAYAIMIKLYQIERNEAMHLWKYSSGGRSYAPMNWQ